MILGCFAMAGMAENGDALFENLLLRYFPCAFGSRATLRYYYYYGV
jgi:hypothetical protein